jgi:class 3 adenylate cyclase/CHASE2 domain-containing sensor protein
LCCSGFFVHFITVKPKPLKRIPALIALGVIVLVCLVRWRQLGFFERLERITYDMRVREAVKFAPPVATNLGFVEINDESVVKVANGSLGFRYGLFWPRLVYGRLVQELADQSAKAIALDVMFAELRPDHPSVQLADGSAGPDSDEFFALQMRQAGNVIIAATEKAPAALFLDSALAPGDVVREHAETLRRAKAFRVYRKWHPAFRQVEAAPEFGIDLSKARVEPRQVVLPRSNGEVVNVPLDQDGNFDLADFGGDKLPAGMVRKAKPFTEQRVWQMGVVLGAQELKLDLAKADVDLPHGRITLRGPGGVERVIPVDRDGGFYIDWCMPPDHPQLAREPMQDLLRQSLMRLKGQTNGLRNDWAGKLVVIGSSATGSNMSDVGATPLSDHTLLASEHWNVASSIITGRFVHRVPLAGELALIVLLGVAAGFLTWEFRALLAFGLVVSLAIAYVVFGVVLYVQTRYWIPLVLPVLGALLTTHVCVVTWRVVFEQAEQRRVKSIFSKIVSPKIVNELLQAETLSLGGARRQITVFFADVRGFTELTDTSQERVAEQVRKQNLTGEAAEACFDEQARQMLETVNLYLGLVADTVIRADGTLNKFIGDCVMAFWGAPTPNSRHAAACVQAAIAVQRAVYELNQQRATGNKRRELENLARISAGLPPRPMLPILLLGSGINTGMATVGLMGSQAEQQDYTVFGREVNLASRLETASGRGRIFIGQTTYEHLLRDDPALAATCVELPAQELRGFRAAVKVYEVSWRPPGAPPFDEEFSIAAAADGSSLTGFIQREGG